jgi:hypothetical protein
MGRLLQENAMKHLHTDKPRPAPWAEYKTRTTHTFLLPFLALEWIWEWLAFCLSNWKFLEVLDYLETLSVLIAVIFYFSERGDRIRQRHYQAWQVINTSQGKGGSGGRIEALEELNRDHVELVGVDASGAFLQGLTLDRAHLRRANLSGADVRNGSFQSASLIDADLHSGNFRDGRFSQCALQGANLNETDLTGADLTAADLDGASLADADLTNAELRNVQWQHLASVKNANIFGVKDAPAGFVDWAMKHGAQSVQSPVQ